MKNALKSALAAIVLAAMVAACTPKSDGHVTEDTTKVAPIDTTAVAPDSTDTTAAVVPADTTAVAK